MILKQKTKNNLNGIIDYLVDNKEGDIEGARIF